MSGLLLYARCPPGGECLRCPVRGGAVTYGPFRSRRRGTSIGINPFPGAKVCSFNCVYCFRGPTRVLTASPPEEDFGVDEGVLLRALEAARAVVEEGVGRVDAVDFSGNGEPTLHPRFPRLAEAAARFVEEAGLASGVGLFTNSTALGLKGVAGALRWLEYVEAKLDTVDPGKFARINAPHSSVKLQSVVEGLAGLRRSFGGRLVVQVMLVEYGGVSNFTEGDARAMAEVLRRIEPDAVHLHTAYRTPRLGGVARAPPEAMERYAEELRKYGLKVSVFRE